jgi:hypothetical protein
LAESFTVVTAFPRDFGFKKAAEAAGFGHDFLRRKNEPICCCVVSYRVRLAQHFVHVVERYGRIEIGLGSVSACIHVTNQSGSDSSSTMSGNRTIV